MTPEPPRPRKRIKVLIAAISAAATLLIEALALSEPFIDLLTDW